MNWVTNLLFGAGGAAVGSSVTATLRHYAGKIAEDAAKAALAAVEKDVKTDLEGPTK